MRDENQTWKRIILRGNQFTPLVLEEWKLKATEIYQRLDKPKDFCVLGQYEGEGEAGGETFFTFYVIHFSPEAVKGLGNLLQSAESYPGPPTGAVYTGVLIGESDCLRLLS